MAKAKESFDPLNLRGVVDLFIARTQDGQSQDEPVSGKTRNIFEKKRRL